MIIQLAAYAMLISENAHMIINSAKILRVGRDETEGFEIKDFTDKIETGWEIFKRLLEIYRLRKEIQ